MYIQLTKNPKGGSVDFQMPPATRSVESVESAESVESVESVRPIEQLMSPLMSPLMSAMSKAMDGDVRDDVDVTDLTEALRWTLLRRSASGDNLSALQSATTSGVSSSEGTECGATADHEPRELRELHGPSTRASTLRPTFGVPSSGHRAHLSTPTRPL